MAAILTRTKEGVMSVFELQGSPIFGIYEGTKPLTCCASSDVDERRKALIDYLAFMEQSASTSSFEIRFYEVANKNGKVNNSDPYFASLPFKVNDTEAAQAAMAIKSGAAPATTSATMDLMFKLFESKMETNDLKWQHRLEQKEEEIRRLEEALNEEDEDDYEDEGLGRIGAITNMIGEAGQKYPWMQDIIKNVTNTFTNLARGANVKFQSMTERPVQMAGVDPQPKNDMSLNDRLKWSQETLVAVYRKRHGVITGEDGRISEDQADKVQAADTEYVNDMVKLAEVASTKPRTFSSAIEALREQ